MLDRKSPPPFLHTTSFELIQPEQETLGNGTEVFFIAGGGQDVIKIELVVPAGRWNESVAGAAYFSANLLSKGTRSKSSFDIAKIFDRFGAHLEIHHGLDFVSIALYGLTKYFAPAFDLLLEIITEPAFPEKELQQHKSIFIQNLKINEEKTSFLAGKAFRKNLFGESHPYGIELEEDHVNKIVRDNLVNHYENFYRTFSVFVSGKIDNTIVGEVTKRLSKLTTKEAQPKTFDAYEPPLFRDRIPKEGSVQASIRMGRKSILRTHPDYAGAVFVSHILGGYFGSRLMKNIREEKGLTYGIYAALHPLQHEAYISIGADVNKENIDLTLGEIKKELNSLRTRQIGAEELDVARNHFIGSFQAELTTPFAHADKIKTLYLSGLSFDYYQDLILKVDAISADEIKIICESHFHEDNFSEIAVG
jgi:zinc protease